MDKGYFKKYLTYDPESGTLRWKVTLCSTAIAGNIAGTKTRNGYIRIQIKGHRYYAHRIAWTLTYGKIPDGIRVIRA